MADLPEVFRGSAAVRAGLVTKAQLRGPRFTRLLPDVYARAASDPPDLLVRSHAAHLFGGDRGVLSGYWRPNCWAPPAGAAVPARN